MCKTSRNQPLETTEKSWNMQCFFSFFSGSSSFVLPPKRRSRRSSWCVYDVEAEVFQIARPRHLNKKTSALHLLSNSTHIFRHQRSFRSDHCSNSRESENLEIQSFSFWGENPPLFCWGERQTGSNKTTEKWLKPPENAIKRLPGCSQAHLPKKKDQKDHASQFFSSSFLINLHLPEKSITNFFSDPSTFTFLPAKLSKQKTARNLKALLKILELSMDKLLQPSRAEERHCLGGRHSCGSALTALISRGTSSKKYGGLGVGWFGCLVEDHFCCHVCLLECLLSFSSWGPADSSMVHFFSVGSIVFCDVHFVLWEKSGQCKGRSEKLGSFWSFQEANGHQQKFWQAKILCWTTIWRTGSKSKPLGTTVVAPFTMPRGCFRSQRAIYHYARLSGHWYALYEKTIENVNVGLHLYPKMSPVPNPWQVV